MTLHHVNLDELRQIRQGNEALATLLKQTRDALVKFDRHVKRELRVRTGIDVTADVLDKLKRALRRIPSYSRRDGRLYIRLVELKTLMPPEFTSRDLSRLLRSQGLLITNFNGMMCIVIDDKYRRFVPPISPVRREGV